MTWEDHDGRLWQMMIPDVAPDEDAEIGIPLYPVDITSLGLPLSLEVRLHNQLFHRKITASNARQRQTDIGAAIRSAIRIGAQQVIELYEGTTDIEDPTPVRDA